MTRMANDATIYPAGGVSMQPGCVTVLGVVNSKCPGGTSSDFRNGENVQCANV